MNQKPLNPTPSPAGAEHDARLRQVELTISTLLRVGVLASLTVLVTGTVLMLVWLSRSGTTLSQVTAPEPWFPHSFGSVLSGLWRLEGPSVAMLGLLVLIATPVLRVAVSIVAFFLQRERAFVLITIGVLLMLIASFLLGKAH